MGVIQTSQTTSATGVGSSTLMINGYIDTIGIDYSSTAAGTTDVTITGYVGGSDFTVYSKANSVTDVVLRPRVKLQDNAGTDVTYDGTNEIYERYYVDRLVIAIAEGGDSKVNVFSVAFTRELE